MTPVSGYYLCIPTEIAFLVYLVLVNLNMLLFLLLAASLVVRMSEAC